MGMESSVGLGQVVFPPFLRKEIKGECCRFFFPHELSE